MNIRYLEILEAIAETGSFTGAAKRLYITQSAVSHAVAQLEEQAKTALFERLPKGVRLTPCGLSLLDEAQTVLSACRNLDRRIAHLEEHTPIQIASSITIASYFLPDLLTNLRTHNPDLKTAVRVAPAYQVLELLRRGDTDIAFWEGIAPPKEFTALPLRSYALLAACAPDFPCKKSPLTMAELCHFPLLLREPGSAIRDTLDHILSLNGQTPSPAWESVNSLSLVKAAEAGLGITILPEQLLSESIHLKRLRPVPLEGMEMNNQMFVLYHQDQYITKPFRRLLDHLKAVSL